MDPGFHRIFAIDDDAGVECQVGRVFQIDQPEERNAVTN